MTISTRCRRIARLALALSFLTAGTFAHALTESDLKWDLSYRSALKAYPVGLAEWMQVWPKSLGTRGIHQRLAGYQGDPIIGSVLIERPDGHTGEPMAQWYVLTKSAAMVCRFHPKIQDKPCEPLDRERMVAFVDEVMALKPNLNGQSASRAMSNGPLGLPVLLNYHGFLSVYRDGKSLQRPIPYAELDEALGTAEGPDDPALLQLGNAVGRLLLSPDEYRLRLQKIDAELQSRVLGAAASKGDVAALRKGLDQVASVKPIEADTLAKLLPQAVASGKPAAVELLLLRGAWIDADESAALKAAARLGNNEMVAFLLSKGAKFEPPPESLGIYKKVFETPLSVAVSAQKHATVALLIDRGANVNFQAGTSVLHLAAGLLDEEMLTLLLAKGAKPDLRIDGEVGESVLVRLMSTTIYRSRSDRQPMEPAARQQMEDKVERMLRSLVAAGAELDFVGNFCSTPHSEALKYSHPEKGQLLVALGADPERQRRCTQLTNQGTRNVTDSVEGKARSDLWKRTRRHLEQHEYAALEALYAELKAGDRRTPSGIWRMAVFYREVQSFPSRLRGSYTPAHIEEHARDWQAQFPQSVPARMLRVYTTLDQAASLAGFDKSPALLKGEDKETSLRLAKLAYQQLLDAKPLAERDPEWYRAMIEVMAYAGYPTQALVEMAQTAMKRYPDYHEVYFTTLCYLRPKWGGSAQAMEMVARQVMKASPPAEKRAVYARLYWYLGQLSYRTTLFKETEAKWPDMRAGFDDLIRDYPDPWNYNAYAYYACLADDRETLRKVLPLMGDTLISAIWGSAVDKTYFGCVNFARGPRP